MKFISFTKFKSYLESNGYVLEKGMNIYYNLCFATYFFSKTGEVGKYTVNVFMSNDGIIGDHVMSINKGHGSIYIGWKSVKIDMRKKFWLNMV